MRLLVLPGDGIGPEISEATVRVLEEVAAHFPDVELEELIVDATAALLIRRPQTFDVLVTTNMFGDILSDEASDLSGSLGLGGAINTDDDVAALQPGERANRHNEERTAP